MTTKGLFLNMLLVGDGRLDEIDEEGMGLVTDKQDEIARLFYREINHDRV